MVTVSVWSEGEGFTEEEGQEMFKKFSNTGRKGARAITDSGLGLFICAEILEQHYGKVSMESETGKSARLVFTFPNPKQSQLS
jgi:signal transduction histidine kinase